MEIIKIKGNIRVGRIKYVKGKPIHPSYPNFTPIVVMTKSSEYGELSPYLLKTKEGYIMENVWQFHKLYPYVPNNVEYYSRWDKTIIWEQKQETHITNGKPNEKYWKWRQRGMESEHPIRYPVGNTIHKSRCVCVLDEDGTRYGIKEGRENVYLKYYSELVVKESKFKDLRKRVMNGENLLIIEIDGPHEESLDYYKETYDVNDDFIEQDTILVTVKNMEIMLKDPKHSFGHGYCLAMTLFNWV